MSVLLIFVLVVLEGVLSGRPPSNCKPSCPKHERYAIDDVSCIKTCGNKDLPWETMGACIPYTGCICKGGYYRKYDNETGPCIKETECRTRKKKLFKNKCKDKNAVYKKCPNPCPLTCDEPKPRPCPRLCLQCGYECKPGFILTKIGGKCILPDDCPKPLCPKHEHYVINDPNEVMTCGNRLIPGDTTEDFMSFTGCLCDSGFVRKYDNGTGPCIPEEQCRTRKKKLFKNKCKDKNAVYKKCPNPCPLTCDEPKPRPCPRICLQCGYECKPGFILTKIGGKCILPDDCPTTPMCGENEVASECKIVCPPQSCENSNPCDDPNASPQECASTCQPTCENPDTSAQICTLSCRIGGCVCNLGYILDKAGGKCIKKEECPKNQTCSDPNASPQDCPSYCQPTCDQPDTSELVCPDACLPSGCVCNPGYILDEDDGTCIKIEDCPRNQQCSDPNASPSTEECTSPCQPTCQQPGTTTEKCSDPNSSHMDCPSYCQPTCDQPDTSGLDCVHACLPSGCVCNSGYILDKAFGTCIKVENCPENQQCRDPNASPMPCPSYCQPTCGQPDTSDILCVDACLPSGCVCNPGYILDEDGGKCIKVEDCPAKPIECGLNEEAVKCRTICPPQNCEISYTEYDCSKVQNICEPGCDCLPNYLRNGSGICIRNDDCPDPSLPTCGVNEIASNCRITCPPQTCDSRFALYKCPGEPPCEPGCDCLPNYLRDSDEVCIPADKCDSTPPEKCPISKQCIRTCASPNPHCVTPYTPAKTNKDGCECMEGYILSEVGGPCIKIEDCPSDIGCNGDPNARAKQCPLVCPSTCERPNAAYCLAICQPLGCECKPGYLFSKIGGKCILPDECPGGYPCGENEEFRTCKYDCPENYCPEDENSASLVCDPLPYCLSGCACKLNYRRLSQEDDRCIVASDCPPVNCTRPNEVYDSCPSACLAERCEDRNNNQTTCQTLVLNCQPRCVCKRNFYRNSEDVCVSRYDCNERNNTDFLDEDNSKEISGESSEELDKDDSVESSEELGKE